MIKRFHQLNESVSGLKDLDFFKDYFIDLLDEYEYKIEIEKQRYVKINQEDNTLFKVIPNPDKLKIELVGNCRVNQLDAILREFSKHNKYAEKERRYSDILIFDINVIQRKHNDNHVDITNPRIVKNTIT